MNLNGYTLTNYTIPDYSNEHWLDTADPVHHWFRSDDAGETWRRVSDDAKTICRGYYYSDLRVDPAMLGLYYGINAFCSLLGQMGCGSFIVRYGAEKMARKLGNAT